LSAIAAGSPGLLIRIAVEADTSTIYRIRHAGDENALTDPQSIAAVDAIYPWFLTSGLIFVGECDGDVVGFSAADTRDGSIWALFVDPAHGRRGYGKKLLDHGLDRLRAAGFDKATLRTGAGTVAHRFYLKRGWRPVGVTNDGDPMLAFSLQPQGK
jgi:GNAT superfamily N-acetyltransferase